LPQAFDLVVAHAPELLPPASEGLGADLQLLADLRHGIATRGQLIGLTQLPDDLVGRVSLAFHRADLSGALFAPKISLAVGWIIQAGSPRHIRSDNGPEFIAKRLRAHLKEHRVETLYVEPGCPWQNGIVESFNGRLRDECMDVEAFYSLAEAKVIIEDYRRYYRDQRPHSSLGYRTPKAFIAGLAAATSDEAPNAMNTENRVDGEEDAAPLPLQTTPSTPLQARPEACVGTT
jgi:hypothetical protein